MVCRFLLERMPWNLSVSLMKPGVLGPAWWFKKVFGWAGFAPNLVAGTSSMANKGKELAIVGKDSTKEVLTRIDLRLEVLSNFVYALAHIARPLSVLIKLVFVGNEIWQVELILGHSNQTAHIWTELLFERREVNVAVAIGIKHVLHQERDVSLGGKDLVLKQMSLEVLVAHEAIAVGIVRSEDLERSRLARAERHVLDLTENATKPSRSLLIRDVASLSAQLFIDISRRRVRPLVA